MLFIVLCTVGFTDICSIALRLWHYEAEVAHFVAQLLTHFQPKGYGQRPLFIEFCSLRSTLPRL